MADNRRKAVAAATAVVAVGAGAAAHFGDDLVHAGSEASHVRVHPQEIHPLPIRTVRPTFTISHVPTSSAPDVVSTANRAVVQEEVAGDESAQEVACAAIDYVQQVGPDADPNLDDFYSWAGEQFDRVPAHRAQRILDAVSKLSNGDLTQVATLYCEAG